MSGMAEVLAAHSYDRERAVCSCSDFVQVGLRCDAQTHPQHVAEALSAAGFGPVKEAAAVALEEAADELARLPYVKPGAEGRDDYELILAVRRGDTDKWLKARAAGVRGEG